MSATLNAVRQVRTGKVTCDMAREPFNETFLAAELAIAAPRRELGTQFTAVRCARIASELCTLGRRYKRLSEALCGGEEQWGQWSGSVEQAQARATAQRDRAAELAAKLIQPWGKAARIEFGDLHIAVVSGKAESRTALL